MSDNGVTEPQWRI